MSYPGERKYNLTEFFGNFFGNFGRLLLSNLLFCLPLTVFVGLLFLLGSFTSGVSIFLVFMIIPLMSPFFAGLINVCRKLTAKRTVRPVKDFFSGIRQNWLFFLINSVLVYLFTLSVWASVMFFRQNMGSMEAIAFLITTILIGVLFIFMELSAVVMAVSVELKITEIFKNSFILVLKGFGNHLKTLFSLFFALTLVYSLAVLVREPLPLAIILGILMFTCLPTLIIYIVVFNSYQTVERLIILPYQQEHKNDAAAGADSRSEENLTLEQLEPLAKGDPEEYVFLNGKTIKRKTILKMIEVRKNQASQTELTDI